MLSIYISTHCRGCETALQLADHLREQRPDLPLLVVDIDAPDSVVPATIIGTPMYTWQERIIFMGNPSKQVLLEHVDAASQS